MLVTHRAVRCCAKPRSDRRTFITETPTVIGIAAVAISTSFLYSRYKIATPNQYLVKTGLGIDDIKIYKKTIVWPGQSLTVIGMHPENYEFQLSALSIEKIPFILPGFFTIGPKDDSESLTKYVRFLGGKDIHQMILGILEGETRILSSKMTLEEIFNNRQSFKETIIKGVQEELDQFGLLIYNANIKEMRDGEESKYFHNMMQKKESETANMAKVDVAEANKRGKVGEKEREAQTRQQIALLEAATIRKENESRADIQMSNTELAVTTSQTNQTSAIAQIESQSNSNIRQHEMEVTVQEKKQAAEIATAKANKLAPAVVDAEITRTLADAELYKEQQRAQAIRATYMAKADGIQELLVALNGNTQALIHFLTLDTEQILKVANANVQCFQGIVQGLGPKMTILNANSGSNDQPSNPIGDLTKMLPMSLMYLSEQLGLSKDTMKSTNLTPAIMPTTMLEVPQFQPTASKKE